MAGQNVSVGGQKQKNLSAEEPARRRAVTIRAAPLTRSRKTVALQLASAFIVSVSQSVLLVNTKELMRTLMLNDGAKSDILVVCKHSLPFGWRKPTLSLDKSILKAVD